MEHIALYRKYRPKSFKEVIGQKPIVTILRNSIKNDKVGHAYIFAGTKGTGKTSIAKIFANAINCSNPVDGDVCSNCLICQDFNSKQTIDVIELDAASNNGVEEIRKINDNISYLPAKLNKKIYIIDEAHMLTTGAWNALLKTIEEPPRHVVFIFATTEIHKIPSTIISRCQCFQFNPIDKLVIINHLEQICDKEQIKFDLESLNAIYDITNGSLRDALSVLQQVAIYANNNITAKDVYVVYGLVSHNDLYNFFSLIINSDLKQVTTLITNYSANGINFSNLVLNIIRLLTEKIIFLKTKSYELLKFFSRQQIDNLNITFSQGVDLLDIWQEVYFKLNTQTDYLVCINSGIFKSINIFENKPVCVNENIILNIDSKKQEVTQSDKDEAFTYEEIKIEKLDVKNEQVDKKQDVDLKTDDKPNINFVSNADNSISNNEILLKAFVNKTKKSTELATEVITDIKEKNIIDQHLNLLGCCKKVLFSSKNAVILLFEDKIDADLSNELTYDENFLLAICKCFGQPMFIVGFTNEEINLQKQTLQSALSNKENYPDCDIKILRDLLDRGQSIEQLAYNLLIKGRK